MLHSLQVAGFLQKGRRRGLCDLLAEVSSERVFNKYFTEGEYQRQVFERDPLWLKNEASLFLWEG